MATILIVDDEPANRMLLAAILGHAGHELLEASDAAMASETLARRRCDLAIVDLWLPGSGGADLIRGIRASGEATAPMAVLLYTASAVDGAMRDFMEAYGVCGAIPKPCEPEEVLRLVEAALKPS